ncbi:hypothetical protein [Xanthomonas cucurbitae]|uniref:DUF4124 domain-containing protein n=1 Tax=Xanthomonas cucurbitae TaxID=56453 RepID=A0A2S7DW59_9XANT|nr:hypothetical protein [Xanthomonas cucurbitae]PPU78020.1 hypothetical protein XcuCFBP2542_04165 [Xanthomonas cucurbitae]WDM68350.1 hypothetical protein K6981_03245 [Xanthomonas cucurbitae]WDM72224.1 hypothetical protein K6978_03245 [Xanthomonas cucurbitae]WDM78555.1 hypothetical protein K6980_15625 [Xanthomonas cucurbitae]WDM82236.1 hypothetical protein K6979_15620 [Xanthomonas cucurbitae]
MPGAAPASGVFLACSRAYGYAAPMPRPLLPLLALLLCLSPTVRVQAQEIRRCVTPDGQTLFTDRRCEDVGAATRAPPALPRQGNTAPYRDGCPRRLSELVSLLQAAVDSRDVNRLSSLYLWSDQSDAAANQVLRRLEAIVQRPLLDIVPMYPQTDAPTGDAGGAAATPSLDGSTIDAPRPAPTRPRPWGLRLEQNLASGTPARSVLRLRRQYNCFWVTF